MREKWPTKRIGDVCDLVGGGTPSKSRPDFYNGDIPWATVRDMNVETLVCTEHSITKAGLKSSSSHLIPGGTVVVATRVGLGKVVMLAGDTAINQDLRGLLIRDPNMLLNRYLYWWYRGISHRVVAAGSGATVQGVTLPFLAALEIPIPPLAEQKRIVAKLDAVSEHASRLDQVAKSSASMWQDLYAAECRNAFEPRTDWKTVMLPEISENLDGIRRPVTRSDRKAGPYPYYGASGVVDHVADYLFEGDLLLVSEDGANLLARSTAIAFTASGKYWVNNHAHVLRFKSPVIHAYVEAYLNSIPIDEWVTGATQPKLNQGALNRIPIPLPGSEAEIARVLKTIRDTQEISNAGSANGVRRRILARDLKQSVLEAVFRGEL